MVRLLRLWKTAYLVPFSFSCVPEPLVPVAPEESTAKRVDALTGMERPKPEPACLEVVPATFVEIL